MIFPLLQNLPSILLQSTVLRSQNLGMLRPEKSWRPIITMEVDGQHKHEIVLGIDGQNPNQREITHLCVTSLSPMHDVGDTDLRSHHAHHKTEIKLNVWHKSKSKAKSRKHRRLVAWTAMPLGEVMKKQGIDPCEPPYVSHVRCMLTKTSPIDVELRLSGIPAARKKSVAQKHQPCASLRIRLRPPPSSISPTHEHDIDEDDGFSLVSLGGVLIKLSIKNQCLMPLGRQVTF